MFTFGTFKPFLIDCVNPEQFVVKYCLHLCSAFYSQESRESQVSAAASAADEQATGPLFSDRTDDTDKTITRYSVPSHMEANALLGIIFKMFVYMYFHDGLLS